MSPPKSKRKLKKKAPAQKLRLQMARNGLPESKKSTPTPGDKHRMSEVLIEFMKPYAEAATTDKRYQALVSVAAIAWNAALFPPAERRQMLDSLIDHRVPSGAEDMKLIIRELIHRKDRHFSDIKRVILSYDLTRTKDGWDLSVKSSL